MVQTVCSKDRLAGDLGARRGGVRGGSAAALLFLAAAMTPLGAAELELLADLNTAGTHDSGFTSFGTASAVLDDRYFLFVGDDGVTGGEPWSLDLTNGELVRLADVAEGTVGSRPEQFTPIGSITLFVATSLDAGEELWATDGTVAGTHFVEDIQPGTGDSDILELFRIPGNRAVFRADDGVHGAELWVSDGSGAGTALVADIRPGIDGSIPGSFAFNGGNLFFRANDGTNGAELWKSTGATTVMVADIEPGAGSSSPSFPFPVAGGHIVFRATRAADGAELWRSDGSAVGTSLVADINPAGSSSPSNFFFHSGLARLFFSADDGVHGIELFQLVAGVATRLSDLAAGSASTTPKGFGETPTKLLFTGLNGAPGTQLFAYDGVGISWLETLATAGVPNSPESVTSWNGEVFLKHGACWRSDGTEAGTVAFDSSCYTGPNFGLGDGRLVYGDSIFGDLELWSIDAGHAIAQETALASLSSEPSDFFWFRDRLFFAAEDGVNGRELWVWDRTFDAGPVLIDLDPGAGSSSPSLFVAFQDEVWFTATSAATGKELWHSDGTAAGTSVYEIEPGNSGVYPVEAVVVGEALFVSTDSSGRLYRVASAAAPPELIEFDGNTSLYADSLIARGAELAFVAWTATTGEELFTLGETGATPLPHELVAGPDDGYFDSENEMVMWDGALYFLADDDGYDAQVWRYDGGAPQPVSELEAGALADDLAAGPDGVYFAADATAIGRELHRYDGVDTVPVSDIAAGEDDSWPGEMTSAGGRLYFRAYDEDAGYELWWTDGVTVERLVDLFPGTDGAFPQNLVPTGERLLFTADDGAAGEEIFIVDDSSAIRLPQVLPGPATATPRFLSASPDGCHVVFSAAQPELGREPFRVQLCLFVDGFESGDFGVWHVEPPV